MSESLFQQLKKIGIDEELASKISASLDPDYNASKKDVLIMQEAMLQLQARSDQRYNEFNEKLAKLQAMSDERYNEFNEKLAKQQARSDERYNEFNDKLAKQQARSDAQHAKNDERYFELKTEMIQGFSEVRSEMHTMNRQFIFAFGGMIVTILSVLAINIYYH